MRILIICNCATGLETFRGMLIRRFINEEHEVQAIVPISSEKKEKAAEQRLMKMGCDLRKIKMERRGMNPIQDLKLLFSYLKEIKKLTPQLVITYTIKPNIYGGIACRILRVPYATNVTGLGTAFQNNGMLKKLVTNMYKVALKSAKIVFFENVENRDIIVEAGIISKNKTHVLAGAGVDLEYFRYIPYPKNEEYIRFIFVGRVMHEKGIDELFHVFSRLNKEGYKCSLEVVGGFEENYLDKIKKYEAEGWLKYLGYKNDVREHIGKAHCFVLPSWHEGMANTNLEAAASGRPVITTNIHGCLEAVENGKSGFLCEKRNEENLYEILKKFIKLPYDEKCEMGVIGRKRMEQIFDKKKVVDETIKLLM